MLSLVQLQKLEAFIGKFTTSIKTFCIHLDLTFNSLFFIFASLQLKISYSESASNTVRTTRRQGIKKSAPLPFQLKKWTAKHSLLLSYRYSNDEQGNCFWSVSINEKQAVIMTVEDNPTSSNKLWRYPLDGNQLQENKTLLALKDVKYFEAWVYWEKTHGNSSFKIPHLS